MARRTVVIDLSRARELRAEGKSWDWLGVYFGVHPNTVQDRLEPDAKQKRRERLKTRESNPSHHRAQGTIETIDAIAVLALVPFDDRSWTEKFMGDPIPARSALGRRPDDTRARATRAR